MLQEGDIVSVKPGTSPQDRFQGQAVYHGRSETDGNCLALERLDGVQGGAQNYWWNYRTSDVLMLETVGRQDPSKRVKTEPETVLEWFQMYQQARFKGVPERYKMLKAKDDELKSHLQEARKEYQVLANKSTSSEKIQRELSSTGMLLANLAEERIRMEKQLAEYESKSSQVVSPELLLKQVESHKKVKSISIHPTTHKLLIGTTMIKRPSGIVRKEMGEFQIELGHRSTSGNIQIYNKTWRYLQYDHPHINGGSCCFSQYIGPLTSSDNSGNLFMFLDTIFMFLETVSRGSEFCKYSTWFRGRKPIKFNRKS